MEVNKLILTSTMAHYKNSMNGKNQNTYTIPPLSSIIGTLKNIYGDNINNFIFGYTVDYTRLEKQIETIYKEVNTNVKTLTCSERFTSDICNIEYMINPIITIYHNINSEVRINNTLNLGKTNCLAKCTFEKSNIIQFQSMGYNQWCPKNVGQGIIQRINKETIYNTKKGVYDYYTELFRRNTEFTAEYTIEDTQEGIQLWNYHGEGKIECYQGRI